MRIARFIVWLLVGVCLLIPLRVRGAADYESVLIKDVPHVKQKADFCGEACAEMYLRKLGTEMDQDDVFDQSGLDPVLGRGCYTRELARALRRIGFVTGPVWYTVAAKNSAEGLAEQFGALHADLSAGVPSIVCTSQVRLWPSAELAEPRSMYRRPVADPMLSAELSLTRSCQIITSNPSSQRRNSKPTC